MSASKPEWSDAPKWARFLAMDNNARWYWFENEPDFGHGEWYVPDGGEFQEVIGDFGNRQTGGAAMKQLAALWYNRARAAQATVDILQTRLNVMRGVALVGWVGFVLVLMGV